MGVQIVIKKGEKPAKSQLNKKTDRKVKASKLLSPIFAIGGYFKGSWKELRMVRWPNRRSTWSLTAAVLMFTGLFLALIVALDAIFNELFNLIIK